eukprot:15432766-Alexandrium_andersonii.AAC.1
MAGRRVEWGTTDLARPGAVVACELRVRLLGIRVVGRPLQTNPVPGGRLPELIWKLTPLRWRALQVAARPNPTAGPK